jgi:hypothetical protein
MAWAGDRAATAPDTPPAFSANDPRRGAIVTLELDKEEFFLGENILLHYHIRNEGNVPFQISVGGDYRGSYRAIRFLVEVTDANGRAAIDPYPNPMCFGGMGGEPNVAPGAEWWEDVPLMRYRELVSPGAYKVRVYHDLGWREPNEAPYPSGADGSGIPAGPHVAPVVAATIHVRMPDEKQARQLVEDMLAAPENHGRSWGQRGQAYPDFELLRYPVYLPIMKELAEKGDSRGLDAIAAMALPEATEAILDLTAHKDKAVAAKAGEVLLRRMPGLWEEHWSSRQSYLAELSWSDGLKARGSQIGWALLSGKDPEGRIRGGQIIQCLGGKDDLPALIKVMDILLPEYQGDPKEQNAYLRPMTVSWALESAARKLVRRGATPPASAGTPGEAVAFLVGMEDANLALRPQGWQGVAAGLLKHDIPFIRDLALRCMPLPLNEAAADAVAACIQDKFEPVQGAACDLAGKSKSARFAPLLKEALRTTTNEWVLRGAFRAAADCGAEMDSLLEICVSRLERSSNDRNMVLLGLMIDGAIQHEGGYGAQSHGDWQEFLGDMQKAWGEFISVNRDALRAGRRFRIGGPPVTREMFPPKFEFDRAGRPPWPDWSTAPLTPSQVAAKVKQDYESMKSAVSSSLDQWKKTHAGELVIQTDPPEIVITEGNVPIHRTALPVGYAWTVYRLTPDSTVALKAPVRLRFPDIAGQYTCKENFHIQGELGGQRMFCRIIAGGQVCAYGKGPARADLKYSGATSLPTVNAVDQSLLVGPPPTPASAPATQPAASPAGHLRGD